MTLRSLAIFLCVLFCVSCSIQKRRYNPGFDIQVFRSQGSIHSYRLEEKFIPIAFTSAKDLEHIESSIVEQAAYPVTYDRALSVTQDTIPCDVILLSNGTEIRGKVLEISDHAIRYKRCDNLEGPVYNFSPKDVHSIRYHNGVTDIISGGRSKPEQKEVFQGSKKMEGFGLAGFISGIFSILILGLLLGSLAIVFGIIGLIRNIRNPDRYKGKGFAIAAMIIGTFTFLMSLLFLISLGM